MSNGLNQALPLPDGIIGCVPHPNEAVGLQWKDVDWEKGSVEIRRNVVTLHGNKWEFDTPKTMSGVRSFTLCRHSRTIHALYRRKNGFKSLYSVAFRCAIAFRP